MTLSAKNVKATLRNALDDMLAQLDETEAFDIDNDTASPMPLFSQYADPDSLEVGYVAGILWIAPDREYARRIFESFQREIEKHMGEQQT